MNNFGKVRIKNLSQLIEKNNKNETNTIQTKNEIYIGNHVTIIDDCTVETGYVTGAAKATITTPVKAQRTKRRGATTSKKQQPAEPKTAKKVPKSAKKELPPSQKKIDSFFKSCSKTYTIEKLPLGSVNTCVISKIAPGSSKKKRQHSNSTKKQEQTPINTRRATGRKRLFVDTIDTETTETNLSCMTGMTLTKPVGKRKTPVKRKNVEPTDSATATCIDIGKRTHVDATKKPSEAVACIDLCSDSEDELQVKQELQQPEEEEMKVEVFGVLTKEDVIKSPPSRVSPIRVTKPVKRLSPKLRTPSPALSKAATPPRLVVNGQHEPTTPMVSIPLESAASVSPESAVSIKLHAKMQLRIASPMRTETSAATSSSTSAASIISCTSSSLDNKKRTTKMVSTSPIVIKTATNNNKSQTSAAKSTVSTDTKCTTNGSKCASPATSSGAGSRRKPRACPSYKLVEGTSFAVDAFQFDAIKGVTHYFLSHFHADHYVGLTRKFAMPLILSPITARLLLAFIPLHVPACLQEITLNEPQVIADVEVTAIDANHCPGAVMFIFKTSTGKCILHTGDFRASPHMESEPVFWNYNIDTIYLDTTYISNKYDFCTQDESIAQAQYLIEEFQTRHADKKILYICGAYLIGKERFWSAIARKNRLIVWTEMRRNMALKAMQDLDMLSIMCANPSLANMHVITMGKMNYSSLVEYFEPYSEHYDLCLAIRPSGWEKNSRPQYRGKINIIGVPYSEHSSHNEMQRFVTYLRPHQVISTVPVSGDLMVTSKVPEAWYKYSKFPSQHRSFQPSITSYLTIKHRNSQRSKECVESTKENQLPVGIKYSGGLCDLVEDPFEDEQEGEKEKSEEQKKILEPATPKKKLLKVVDLDADYDWIS